MKVAALTLSISRRAGGMMDCVRRLLQNLECEHGFDLQVISLIDNQTEGDRANWSPLPLHLFTSVGPSNLAYTPRMARCLSTLKPDLIHIAGLWTYQSYITHSWSEQTRKPYIVAPHGMLDPWARNHSRWRKRVVGLLYENRHLRDAACLQATCLAELEAIRSYGLNNPVCIVPNGVDLPAETPVVEQAPWCHDVPTGHKVLLYLGRLHPKKGIPNLLHAWAALGRKAPQDAADWNLVIAGWEEAGHLAQLQTLVSDLGIARSVHFTGPLYGANKVAAFQRADAFVLPSLSEGLPLAVLEAWSHRLPVLITTACNLPEGARHKAAWECAPMVDSLLAALIGLVETSQAERLRMGQNGRMLVERQFTWQQAGARMAEVYRWVSGEAGRPECVTL